MAPKLGDRQAELYRAEGESIAGVGRRWERVGEVQAYVDALIESSWFFERWPHLVRCTVERRGRGSVWSTCRRLDADGPGRRTTEGVVLLADGGLTQPVVLHELAHLLLPPEAGHGTAFAETMLRLVRHEMGFFAFADYDRALRSREAFRSVVVDG